MKDRYNIMIHVHTEREISFNQLHLCDQDDVQLSNHSLENIK